ncbi:beta-glucosidase [Anaerobacterium chartisolvens]|uniref:Periplasmic beta-glucosidase n=1 Tax=Anaerobacterium chartisolvens TaxID=1297424 RepID=A0A369ANZ4_9FIRM|nr:glycoside hydrolase family 3 N-terminal domain-containing protein [Anaerobacterium chartisolvens]RCX09907.1 beta-glucosidase [Anaerobacterium chartisolvens]
MYNKQLDFVNEKTERKINELLEKMTLQEKIGQLTQISPSIFGAWNMDQIIQQLVDGQITVEEFEKMPRDYHENEIREGTVGSLGGITNAKKANELQRIAVEESRVGIPLLFGFDVIHGFRTIFPIPLAESCGWEPELAKKTAEIAAKEASAAGINWTFAPMVDIARDPRWGRVAEGAGEDTCLGSAMSAARVEGFQGDDLSNTDRVLACVKHYAAYGAVAGGRDYNTTDMSLQTLHEVYLPPFEAAAKAGSATFMCSFNDLNGVPCAANKYLMSDILRDKFGFKGLVVSDANSIAECVMHGHAKDDKEASLNSLLAGVEVDMSHGTYRESLPALVSEGTLQQKDLDEAVRRVLRVKFMLGLFEKPYRTDEEKEANTLLAAEHVELAREASRRSIVLLKNENNTLPLCKNVQKIAVVGPLADNKADMLGSWAGCGKQEDAVSVLEGIKAVINKNTEVIYAKGCGIIDDDTGGLGQAVYAAEQSDIVIAVVGESAEMSGEAGSRIDLVLPGKQEELLRELKKTGKPLVVVLINGRPLSIPWVKENASVILEAWQLGVQSGNAIADVLFGDYNPSGKLTVTFPYSVGQVPVYYNHPMTGRPAGKIRFSSKYIDGPTEPLYPFGYGLSYTTFKYENLSINPSEASVDGVITAEVDITNTGSIFGEEVVQLYVCDLVASRVRPVKELKGFKKIALKPGETQKVRFEVDASSLGFYNENMNYIVEPGEFKICVGPNSTEGLEGVLRIL